MKNRQPSVDSRQGRLRLEDQSWKSESNCPVTPFHVHLPYGVLSARQLYGIFRLKNGQESKMRRFFVSAAILLASAGCGQKSALVTPKHIELPSHYDQLARTARLQGTVTLRLSISGDGTVIDANPSSTDRVLEAHPLLQRRTEELIRRWKFTCANCAEHGKYSYVVTFIYRLEGTDSDYDDTHVAVDLPDHVTITANSPITTVN